jgi:GTPase Era involved in 16S rRNA processing
MSIELKAIAKKSNGRDYIKFKLGVHSENQMRLVIGTKGNNINVIKNLFIKQYCKDKDAEPDVDIQVSIMDKYQQRLAESEETVSSQDEFKRVAESELK